MEIVHWSVMVNLMQVAPRLFALYGIVNATTAQNQWGAGLMILSWSMMEATRYASDAMTLITKTTTTGGGEKDKTTKQRTTPDVLLSWLRYSAYAICNPLAYVGELTIF